MSKAFDEVMSSVWGCDRHELEMLVTHIEGMLANRQQGDEGPGCGAAVGDGSETGARGYVEEKMIGKWGPYRYLRYWQDGRLRSKYLGKAK